MINKIIIKDKKGQLGKILTTIPTFLLIVFIMGLFLAGSFFIAKVRGVAGEELKAESFSAEGNVLLKKVAITTEKENKIELSEGLILDAIYMYETRKINEEDFEKTLERLVDTSNPCLVIIMSGEILGEGRSKDFFTEFSNGKAVTINPGDTLSTYGLYRSQNKLNKISLIIKNEQQKNVKVDFEHYLGECVR